MAQATLNTPVSTKGDSTSSATITINTNNYSGTNRMLVCGIMTSDGDNETVSSATWNAGAQPDEPMTEQVEIGSLGVASTLYTLTSFTEANDTITINWTGTIDNYIIWATVMTNVDTTSPIVDTDSASGTASSFTLNGMTGEGNDDLIIDNLALEASSITLTEGADQTEIIDDDNAGGGFSVAGAMSTQDGADGSTMTYSSSASDLYCYVGMIVKGSTGGGGGTRRVIIV